MKKIISAIIIIILALIAVAWFYYMRPVPVEVAVAKRGGIRKIIPEDGLVRTRDEVNISSEISGKIEKMPVEEGQRVQSGEILAEIAKVQLAAQVIRAETELLSNDKLIKELDSIYDKAKADLDRMQALVREGAISQERFEVAQLAFASARKGHETAKAANEALTAALKSAKDYLDKATIRAPIDGVVTAVYKKPGEIVAPGMPLMRIINPKRAYIEIKIADSDMGEVKVAQRVRITADGCPGQEFEGILLQIIAEAELKGERIDVATVGEERIFRGVVRIPDHPECLRPGMPVYADVIIEPKENALIIPREAVFSESGKFYVYVLKNGRAQKRQVLVGIKESERVEIIDGVSEGEQVAVSGLDNLKDGKRVNVK